MKKYLGGYFGDIVLGIGIVVLAGIIFYQQSPLNVKGAGGNFNNVKIWSTTSADPYMNHATATSTQTNLLYVGTASSTHTFATDSIDQVNFNLFFAMATTTRLNQFEEWSSTSTTSDSILPLLYCYDFSDDEVNWFPLTSNCSTVTSSTNGTSTSGFAVTNVNSNYMRIHFSVPTATSTRVGLHAQAIGKKGY